MCRLRASEVHTNLQAYLSIDDGILDLIKISNNPLLTVAQNLLNSFNSGHYYHVVFITKLNLLDDLKMYFNLSEGDDTFLQVKRNIDYGISHNIQFYNESNDVYNENVFP